MRRLAALVLTALVLAPVCMAAETPAGWEMVPSGAMQYDVLKDGHLAIQVATPCWGPNWRYFGIPGKESQQQGARTYTGEGNIGGTTDKVSVVHTMQPLGADEVALTYRFTAPQDAGLVQLACGVTPQAGLYSRGQLTAVSPDGAKKDIPLPLGRSAVNGTFSRLVFTGNDGGQVTVEMDPALVVTSDVGQARLRIVGASMAAGRAYDARITITFPAPVKVYMSTKDNAESTDTTGWFPYPVGRTGMPIDLSFLNKDAQGHYIPAGSHGFLHVKGDRFVFDDGTPGRFWGVNVTAGAALSTPGRAKQIAERLARLGVNVVRLHHLDSWANPIIDYKAADGTTQHLNPENMKRLDETIYQLKMHGIYVILDPWVQRCFRPGDGVEDYGHMGQQGNFNLHPYIFFDPKMRELHKKYIESVWTHVNPYTGVAYRDEPACIVTEIANEALMMRGANGVRAPYYRKEFVRLYQDWARKNGADPNIGDRIITQNYGKDNIRFYDALMRGFYSDMHRFYRSIGVRIPINATNWYLWTWEIDSQTGCDFMDIHHYYGGDNLGAGSGLGGLWVSHPPDVLGGPFGRIAGAAVAGQPLTVSECGNCPPKTYRSSYELGLAAVACLQGWDSLTGFAYSQSGGPRDTLSAYEWESDPAILASLAAGALVYRRGDVSPATRSVAMVLPQSELYQMHYQNGGREALQNTPLFNALVETDRAMVAMPGQDPKDFGADRTITREQALAYKPADTVLKSDTGQLWRDWSIGVGTIDTPRTQAAYGMLGRSGKAWKTADCTFDVTTPYAVTSLSSLTEEPLASSGRLLLVAVARAENTGQAHNLARTKITIPGKAPVLVEPVVGSVTFRTSHKALTLRPYAADGKLGPAVSVPVKDGMATVQLRPEYKTIFYAIQTGD